MMGAVPLRGGETGTAVIAIPAKDEAACIRRCLIALGHQNGAVADAIVLVVNNTTDATATLVRDLAGQLPVPIEIIEHDFPVERACAGAARRMAMERAAALAGPQGFVLTTDADGQVSNDWVAANLFHLRRGLDAVAGRAKLDAADEAVMPLRLRRDDELECAYAAALDELAALVLPSPWDPWPRHTEHSGASIAVTVDAYRRVGGMPAAAVAEDRKFFGLLIASGARVRHAPEIIVTVSGRTAGRAEGGMADTIRRRLRHADPYLDDALEPALDRLQRLRGELLGQQRLVPSSEVVSELDTARTLLARLRSELVGIALSRTAVLSAEGFTKAALYHQ